MSIFGEAANRLIRTKWENADELAKELFSLFTSHTPLHVEGAIEITKTTGRAPFKIIDRLDTSSTDGLFSLESNDRSDQLTYSDLTLLEGAGSDPNSSDLFSFINAHSTPGQIPGIIRSGTGNSYLVDIYRNGYPGSFSSVNVTQLQIDPNDTIPPGTFVMVSQFGQKFQMQAPVYL